MRLIATVVLGLTASSASAHAGHIADVAGHDHWVAGVAVGVAILVGLWGALKGEKTAKSDEADTSDTEESVA